MFSVAAYRSKNLGSKIHDVGPSKEACGLVANVLPFL